LGLGGKSGGWEEADQQGGDWLFRAVRSGVWRVGEGEMHTI
jgi:hypothetical protein